ncbi:MAG: CorA family divalent cation transporter [Planctomycetota bacterium]
MSDETDRSMLLNAYRLPESGGGAVRLSWSDIEAGPPEHAWVDLDRKADGVEAWLRDAAGLDPIAVTALLQEETRPRASILPGGTIVILRAVNFTEGAEPEDLVVVRMFVQEDRVFTLRKFPMRAIEDLCSGLESVDPPMSPGAVVVSLARRISDRMETVIDQLAEQGGQLETDSDALIEHTDDAPEVRDLRARSANIRRRTTILQRYLSPQCDALRALAEGDHEWLNVRQSAKIRELVDRLTRDLEDLERVYEQTRVASETITTHLSEQTAEITTRLTIVAAIFLPLSLVSGVLGMNVTGIPLGDHPWSFLVTCAALLVIGVGLWLYFRDKRWL